MCFPRERYLLGTGIILGMGWGGIPKVAPGHPMMSLSMGGQGPRRQARVAIRASDPLVEPFPVDVYLPLHPEAGGLHRVDSKRMESLISHAHLHGHIGVEAHAFEDFRQGVKGLLKACHLS